MAHSMGIPRGDSDEFVTCSRCKLSIRTTPDGDDYATIAVWLGFSLVETFVLCLACRRELLHFAGLVTSQKGGDGQAQSQSQSWTPGK